MSQSQSLPLRNGPVRFEGEVSLEITDQGVVPWRVPFEQRDLFHPTLQKRAVAPAGVRLTLLSDSPWLAVEVDPSPYADQVEGKWTFDLLVDGTLFERRQVGNDHRELLFEGLGDQHHRLELYLPQATPVRVEGVRIAGGARAEPFEDERPRWVTYGSSITQCKAAAGPSETWPAIVANQFDLHLTCLGFGGQCHMDPMVGRTLADLSADSISLCLGINTYGGSYSERTWPAAAIGLIKTIRDGHPHTPMACVSPIHSRDREDAPGPTGMTLNRMRGWLADAVEKLKGHGDGHLHYVDGLELFGPEHDHHMPDHVHPDAEGYRVLAQQYASLVMPVLGYVPQAV